MVQRKKLKHTERLQIQNIKYTYNIERKKNYYKYYNQRYYWRGYNI